MPAWTRTKSKQEQEERAALVQKEIAKRRGQSATYTQPFVRCHCGSGSSNCPSPVSVTAAATTTIEEYDQDVQSFLTEFYGRGIFERSADMVQLLQLYPDTLAVHYALLVPGTVSFDQFWSRYYYKCSATTILREWSQRDADAALVKSATVQRILPTLQQQLQKREIERGLGSRQALLVVESSSLPPPSHQDTKDASPKSTPTTATTRTVTGNSKSSSSSSSSSSTLWEERVAARAQSLYEEAFSDIVETIPEESLEHGDHDQDDDDDDDADHDDAVAIGFAASG
jgi:BSD domain